MSKVGVMVVDVREKEHGAAESWASAVAQAADVLDLAQPMQRKRRIWRA